MAGKKVIQIVKPIETTEEYEQKTRAENEKVSGMSIKFSPKITH